MRVCAVSDLHGRLPQIPECDVLVIAGDICPDADTPGLLWDPDGARVWQMNWLRETYAEWEAKVPATHIHVTPGNHDWINEFPPELRSRFHVDEGVTIDGKTFWFTPWVSPCGGWNYEQAQSQREYRFDNMPYKLDLLVMHAPAFGVGDLAYGDIPAGCRAMKYFIEQRQPRHVVFGHIHEGQRYGREHRCGGSKCYNVAMWGENWQPLVLDI
jgi:Icc-related predicted phosphoesterase